MKIAADTTFLIHRFKHLLDMFHIIVLDLNDSDSSANFTIPPLLSFLKAFRFKISRI